MKKIILAILLAASFTQTVHAYSFAKPNQNMMNKLCTGEFEQFGGGHDTFPWSVARPFPWTSVEGLWSSIDSEKKHIIFDFKVTRTTAKIKQLSVSIYDLTDCKKAHMRGVGLINNSEKNVVRVNIDNTMLKLAMFKMADLELNSLTCGSRAMGASFFKLTESENEDTIKYNAKVQSLDIEDSSSMLLKKISDTTKYKCK